MNSIARGTTPSLTFNFKTVKVKDIAAAYLTIEQLGEIKIEKALNDAVKPFEENKITWELTQKETLLLHPREEINLQLRYRLVDDSAFVSQIFTVSPYDILKEGVI